MPKTALRLGFTVLLLAVSRNTLADPVTINVVSTHFNVNLSGYANSGPPGGSGGSAAFSASSSDPIASTTIQPDSLNPYVYARRCCQLLRCVRSHRWPPRTRDGVR